MKIAYITNLRAPYRSLQLSEYSKIKNLKLTAYYTDKPSENRKWNIDKPSGFNEIDLKGCKIAGKFGYINAGLLKLVKNNDLIVLGCYEQPTYIILSILCKLLKKSYILSFDGISTDRLVKKESFMKKSLKKIVINNSEYIMGNGNVSKRYFNETFEYPLDRIYNQYLAVNSETINELCKKREIYRAIYRKKLNISENDRVLIYSGRLIDIKNVDSIIRAISMINDENIVILITGGGTLEENLVTLSKDLNVKTIITGFISEQEDLFKHYFVGDVFILPSKYEPWGLVVNEAMHSGLPVIVSNICGCSLDLVKHDINGYLIDPNDDDNIAEAIKTMLNKKDLEGMGRESKKIIEEWNVANSAKNFEQIIIKIFNR